MKILSYMFHGVVLLSVVTGCDAVAAVAGAAAGVETPVMNVDLVNASPDFPVEVTLFFHEDDDVLESILTTEELGSEKREVTVPAGQTLSLLPQDCDNLQAIIIEDADLLLVAGVGPEEDTRVYRGDGEDFNCGDRLVFTFSHLDVVIPTDLNIRFDAR